LMLSFLAFVMLSSDLGDVTLAANQVLLQFMHVTAYALDGFAHAAETFVGAAVGAKQRGQLRQAARIAGQWGLGGAILLGAMFWLFGGAVIDLMTTSEAVRGTARAYLWWLILAPVLGFASWILDGIFIGATWTRAMRNAMLQSVALYVVALAVLVPVLGNHGLWLALMILNVVRAATLALRYPRLEAQVLQSK